MVRTKLSSPFFFQFFGYFNFSKCKPKQGWCKPVQRYERNNVNQFSLTFPNLSTFFRESHNNNQQVFILFWNSVKVLLLFVKKLDSLTKKM